MATRQMTGISRKEERARGQHNGEKERTSLQNVARFIKNLANYRLHVIDYFMHY